ncbi:MAG: cytochrome P450 [Actinomycetota bacterium]
MAMTADEAASIFYTPEAYADDARFEEACAFLRRNSPVHLVRHPDGEVNPFWAITKHADVLEIELHNNIFLNEPRPVLGPAESDRRNAENGHMLRTLIHVDDPEHRELRGVTSEWFLPKNMARLDDRLAGLAVQYVDKMASLGGQCDFATDIAMHYPLNVILHILGLPESDYPRMLKLTQELFGAADEDLRRDDDPEAVIKVIEDFFAYFTRITEERRANPTDDLASAVANGRINGEELNLMQTISYYVITATAGHDTTASAMAGGVLAFIQHPDQWERLKKDPSLVGTAADEIIRWVTPVKHFMRTANEDYTLASGQTIRKGESVLLSYPSANRDEDVFTDPHVFDIGRSPNKHLSFGFGVHYCLGAMLARMEIKAMLAEMVRRVERFELAGEPKLMKTTFVGGLKRLPVSYVMA